MPKKQVVYIIVSTVSGYKEDLQPEDFQMDVFQDKAKAKQFMRDHAKHLYRDFIEEELFDDSDDDESDEKDIREITPKEEGPIITLFMWVVILLSLVKIKVWELLIVILEVCLQCMKKRLLNIKNLDKNHCLKK